MKNLIVPVRVLILAVLLLPGLAHAQRYQVSVGPRPIAMGDAFGAVSDDYSAIFWNPAGLARIGNQEVAFSLADRYGLGLKDNYLAFVLPMLPNHVTAIDWYNSSFDDGELDFSENRFTVAYGLNLPGRLSVGAAAKFLRVSNALDGRDVGSGNGFGLDLGALAGPYRGFRFALVGQDVTDTQIDFTGTLGTSEVYPSSVRASTSWSYRSLGTVAFDVDDWIHVGTEVNILEPLALRAGYQTGTEGLDEEMWSFGAGVEVSGLRFDYAYTTHAFLGETNHFGVSAAFQFNPAQLRIEEVRADELYASLSKSYADEPIGTVRIRNLKDEPVTARLGVFVPSLMESATEREIVLRPGAIQDFPLTAVFSEEIMALSEDRHVQIEVSASYSSARVVRTDEGKGQTIVYAPGAINWARGVDQAAAFVTPRDPVVAAVAREASRTAVRSADSVYPSRNIAFASAMFNALDVLGCAYVPDPNNPYGSASGQEFVVDTIHYPSETLQKRTGDCDDTSVLMASMLENVGVPTKLVDVPGHIMILVGTGIEARHAAGLAIDEAYTAEIDGQLWIPLETTALGGGFANAWARGAEAYGDWVARGRVSVVDVTAAQTRYEPSVRASAKSAPQLDVALLEQALATDSEVVAGWRQEYLASRFGGFEGNNVVSTAALNEVAHAYYLAGQFDRALEKLQEALALDSDDPRTNNNLAAVYIRSGEPGLAVGYLQIAAGDDDVGIRLNLAIALNLLGDEEGGASAMDDAIAEAGGLADALRVLGVQGVPEEGEKAAEDMSRERITRGGPGAAPLYWKF